MAINNLFEQSEYTSDKNLLEPGGVYRNQIPNGEFPNGRFIMEYNEVNYECFFFNKHKKRLYVVLNGARPIGESPVFKRWSWYTFMDGSYLNIDDPMYEDFPSIKLGWYWGNCRRSYRHDVIEIVKMFTEKYNYTEVVFYGSSGGGTAAIHCASLYEESVAVVINPQIKVSLYEQAYEFEEITGIDLLGHDEFYREDLLKQITESKSKFIFIENIRSDTDRNQTQYLLEYFSLENDNCVIGLNRLCKNVFLWIYEAKGLRAHENQEWKTMFRAIEYLINIVLKDEYSQELVWRYALLSEFWKERYELIDKVNRQIWKINTSSLYINNSKRILYQAKMILDAKNDVYNHLTIPIIFKPCMGYLIRIDEVVVSEENIKSVIAIKDERYNEIIFSETIDTEYNGCFFAGKDTSKIELRIYPNRLGDSQNISMIVRGLTIYCI